MKRQIQLKDAIKIQTIISTITSFRVLHHLLQGDKKTIVVTVVGTVLF